MNFGAPDILVNNAGILHKAPLADTLASDFDRVVAVNLRGSFLNAREIVGTSATDVSYDIDFVDPAFAPGTGTPEVGGPDSFQAIQVARRLKGVNIVGADLVEVSPPFDASGGTAFLGVSIMFEMLCNMAQSLVSD
ncbi:MAG: hypothetical protein COC12_03095 [Rhodobacteraceae bacterium]|nr:MAG: hypothetical protein COC12_03095 [Paracoccaceae bacterium]